METTVQTIPVENLLLAFIPVTAVLAIHWFWLRKYGGALYALSRMVIQLLVIGYFLTFIFGAEFSWIIIAVLTVMVFAASWISLRTTKVPSRALYANVLLAIAVGGGITLVFITQGVLQLEPWYSPRYMVPLAGMIFGSSMNSISLAVERFGVEVARGSSYSEARNIAFITALIPITNSLFAVGLVSLPGMMTGQILSGVDPLIAVRYQIMVMCMIFASAGISAALFLFLMKFRWRIFIELDTKD